MITFDCSNIFKHLKENSEPKVITHAAGNTKSVTMSFSILTHIPLTQKLDFPTVLKYEYKDKFNLTARIIVEKVVLSVMSLKKSPKNCHTKSQPNQCNTLCSCLTKCCRDSFLNSRILLLELVHLLFSISSKSTRSIMFIDRSHGCYVRKKFEAQRTLSPPFHFSFFCTVKTGIFSQKYTA